MRQHPFLIGLTGNIATGKSQVAHMLAELGARVIDADKVAHYVMRPDGPAYRAVVEAFGPRILTADGAIDRASLGELVFRDATELRRLEALVHPAVIAEVEQQIAEASEPAVVVEAIKLVEAGLHRGCDELWVVTAPRQAQIERLMATRGLSAEEAALRVDSQSPQAEKAALADRVIVNDKDLNALRNQVQAAWTRIRQRLTAGRADSLNPMEGEELGAVHALTIRSVRRRDLGDAAGAAAVINAVVGEGRYTVISGHWTPEAEQAFIQSLGARSEMFVAEVDDRIVGLQSIEPFAAYTPTMDHVGTLGTYVLHGFRGRGIGRKLADETLRFAVEHGYEKLVVYVLADNELGLAYYRSLGFASAGVLRRQTKIGGVYHDEVFMELCLEGK